MVNNLIENLRKINKDYFTISDLEKITGTKKKSLLVKLSRLQKRGEIVRLIKGYYQISGKFVDLEKIITQIYPVTYISFESALASCGILSQKPYILTLATIKRPKKITIIDRQIEFRRLKKELFFGFELNNGVYIAKPEKALLDQLYLVSLGKATLSLEELDLKIINRNQLFVWAKKYPLRTQKLVAKLMGNFSKTNITIR